jgi:hypothetical protein
MVSYIDSSAVDASGKVVYKIPQAISRLKKYPHRAGIFHLNKTKIKII